MQDWLALTHFPGELQYLCITKGYKYWSSSTNRQTLTVPSATEMFLLVQLTDKGGQQENPVRHLSGPEEIYPQHAVTGMEESMSIG